MVSILGHQAVLKNLIAKAKELGLPSTVMVFEPQPEEVFAPEQAPARLSRLRDKYEQLAKLGVDRLLCIKFDAAFSSQSAQTFVHDLLVEKLGVSFLVVGDDFRFGKGRTGDFTMLQQEGEKFGFDVVSTASFRVHDCRISSTAIREALQSDDLTQAHAMLGRPFTITGKVVHGDKKGRTIGFPTANVLLKRCKAPVNGVYAVTAQWHGRELKGVANVGTRPTVSGERSQLEVHFFDLQENLYGQFISVAPVAKIRDERRFDSFDALKLQIAADAEEAKRILSTKI